MTFKIIFHKEKCIGCGACSAVCPDNWELRGDKAYPKVTELTEKGCNADAQDICPAGAIEIVEE